MNIIGENTIICLAKIQSVISNQIFEYKLNNVSTEVRGNNEDMLDNVSFLLLFFWSVTQIINID